MYLYGENKGARFKESQLNLIIVDMIDSSGQKNTLVSIVYNFEQMVWNFPFSDFSLI